MMFMTLFSARSMDRQVAADMVQSLSSGILAIKHNTYAKRLNTSIKRASAQSKKTQERNAVTNELEDLSQQIAESRATQKSLQARAKELRAATGVKVQRKKANKGKQRMLLPADEDEVVSTELDVPDARSEVSSDEKFAIAGANTSIYIIQEPSSDAQSYLEHPLVYANSHNSASTPALEPPGPTQMPLAPMSLYSYSIPQTTATHRPHYPTENYGFYSYGSTPTGSTLGGYTGNSYSTDTTVVGPSTSGQGAQYFSAGPQESSGYYINGPQNMYYYQ